MYEANLSQEMLSRRCPRCSFRGKLATLTAPALCATASLLALLFAADLSYQEVCLDPGRAAREEPRYEVRYFDPCRSG
eukprot:5408028-Pleurochrysis_carterae.AAC.3